MVQQEVKYLEFKLSKGIRTLTPEKVEAMCNTVPPEGKGSEHT